MLEEIKQYLGMIDDLHEQIIALLSGLTAEALNWRPDAPEEGEGYNSLAALAAHVAGAERFWSVEVIGGTPVKRDRPAEFKTVAQSPEPLIENLRKVGEETRQALQDLSADALLEVKQVRERTVPVRWAILHLIDHAALHLGHMQITTQLYHHGKNHPNPRWFERQSS
ncbi:MAG: DinB family protein [Anaerolineae bacterium]|nr:DinB family protein [Anaerolineae bacterium]